MEATLHTVGTVVAGESCESRGAGARSQEVGVVFPLVSGSKGWKNIGY